MPAEPSRRLVLRGGSSSLLRVQNPSPAQNIVDHLLLGVADLDRGIAWVEQRTGVRAAIGGTHPGAGTRNALLSLGAGSYLEIIAPDPAQSAFNFQFDVRQLAEPRLITWAAATNDIEDAASMLRAGGYRLFGPRDGSRQRPSGELLRWKTLAAATNLRMGPIDPIPFFIQWAPDSPHPSQDSPAGCTLLSLHFQHPDPSALSSTFRDLGLQRHDPAAREPGRDRKRADQAVQAPGIEVNPSKSASARISATVRTPAGTIKLE